MSTFFLLICFSLLIVRVQAQTTTDSLVDFWSAVRPKKLYPAFYLYSIERFPIGLPACQKRAFFYP